MKNECVAVEPKFVCTACGSRFRRKVYLKDHSCSVNILLHSISMFLYFPIIVSILQLFKIACLAITVPSVDVSNDFLFFFSFFNEIRKSDWWVVTVGLLILCCCFWISKRRLKQISESLSDTSCIYATFSLLPFLIRVLYIAGCIFTIWHESHESENPIPAHFLSDDVVVVF